MKSVHQPQHDSERTAPYAIPKCRSKRGNRKKVTTSIDPLADFALFEAEMMRLDAAVSDEVGDHGSTLPTDIRDSNDQNSPEPDLSRNPQSTSHLGRRLSPNESDKILNSHWREVIPTLVGPLSQYYSGSRGRPIAPVMDHLQYKCGSPGCSKISTTQVLVLTSSHYQTITVTHCHCKSVPQLLVRYGWFPASPSQPRLAISIDLLDLFKANFEQTCDAVQATAVALNVLYGRRGFHLLNKEGDKYQEPFRRGLGNAFQWLDVLRIRIELQVDDAVAEAEQYILAYERSGTNNSTNLPTAERDLVSRMPQATLPTEQLGSVAPPALPPVGHPVAEISSNPVPNEHPQPPLPPKPVGQCARFLSQLCPACFGGSSFGRSFDKGGDIHVCTDGNYNHRHLVSGGQGVPFHNASHILPKDFVDAVGDHLDRVRQKKPKARSPKVPDEAIDSCQDSFEAASGEHKSEKASPYDAQGWMSLICRHDIPLFLANIDTPGERQKYPVALLIWLFAMLPPEATVTTFYDIGCILDRSTQLYEIFPQEYDTRLQFVTTAMHAYGHQWACQLLYNPRLKEGMGLTDGEGVERIWSRLTRLIALVRTSSFERRLWLTDRLLSAISDEMRDGLADWIKVRSRKGVEKQVAAAQNVLDNCKFAVEDLRRHWALQQESELRCRPNVPAQLKNQIDVIQSLEHELTQVERTITSAKSTLSLLSHQSKEIVDSLLADHKHLQKSVDKLYTSLSVPDSLPALKMVDPNFARILMLAHNLKIKIRQQATNCFFEYEVLDQAAKGKDPPLGTARFQKTKKGVQRREPGLVRLVKRYNTYCDELKSMNKSTYCIPLPPPLPIIPADLQKDLRLWDDVWMTSSSSQNPPQWLTDEAVRVGIRAVRKLDRCAEEQDRLAIEVCNMCSWYGHEMAAVELAVRTSKNVDLKFFLVERRDQLLRTKARWSYKLKNVFNCAAQLESCANDAQVRVDSITGATPSAGLMDCEDFCYVFIPHDADSETDEESDDDFQTVEIPEIFRDEDVEYGRRWRSMV